MTALVGCDPAVVEMLGAFALDAVDADERLLVEDHLRGCPRCRDEVAQHREVAAQLAIAGSAAPQGLWSRIAAELDAAEPEPDLARLYPLTARGHSPRWATRGLVSAAAVIVVLLGALGWEVHTQDDRVQGITAAFAQTGVDRAAQYALVDPNSKEFYLTSANGRFRLEAVLQPDGNGYLVPGIKGSLPALSSDQTYQLWGIIGGQRISVGVLGPDPGVVAFRASAPKIAALAITTEAAGGVTQSSHTPVVVGFVPSFPSTLATDS